MTATDAEKIDGRDVDAYEKFKDAVFRAYIKGNAIKTNSHGDWEITFILPRHGQDITAEIVSMSRVLGMPVEVLVRKWQRSP